MIFLPVLMVPLTMQSAPLPPRLRAVPRMLLKRAQGTHHAHLNESRQSRRLLGLRLLIILIIIVVASARTAVLDATLRRSSNQGSRASRQRRTTHKGLDNFARVLLCT